MKRAQKPHVKTQQPKKSWCTWYQSLRAWVTDLDQQQQQRTVVPKESDKTVRRCLNCSHVYEGRVCPQCGQVGSWDRYTWRQALLNFLDIWGLGNRPMFRTLRELFWRPGYMVRDYLNGHRQFYFPPFKLLALAVLFTFVVGWLMGMQMESIFSGVSDIKIDRLTGFAYFFSNASIGFLSMLSKHPLYEWLFVGMFIVICIWIGFRRVSKYNLVETYIFLIFILSQYLILNLPLSFFNGIHHFVQEHSVLKFGNGFSLTNYPLMGFFDAMSTRVMRVYKFALCLLVLLDFRQFYGLKWKSTIWRLSLSAVVMMAILGVLLLLSAFVVFYNDEDTREAFITMISIFVLLVLSFWCAAKYMNKNKSQVPKSVIWLCRVLMLSVVWGIGIYFSDKFNLLVSILLLVLVAAVNMVCSLLPIVVYKRYHRLWLAFLPTLLVIAVAVIVTVVA